MLQCLLALCLLGGQLKTFTNSQILNCTLPNLHFAWWPIQTFTNSQILNCTLPNLQLHIATSPIFTSPLSFTLQTWQVYIILWASKIFKTTLPPPPPHHFHISTFTLQTWQVYIILRASQNFWIAPTPKSIDCPIYLFIYFWPNFVFLGSFFLLGWVGGLVLVAYPPTS
jgi:hypothetical protein